MNPAHNVTSTQPGKRPSRTLHLVDVENLTGPGGDTASALRGYQRRLVRAHDHVIVAAAPKTAFVAKQTMPGSLVRAARGKDGADLALLREIDVADVKRRFDRVVLVSGDGIFADLVAILRSLGLAVVIVARPESLSKRVRGLTLVIPPPAPVPDGSTVADLEAA